MEHIPSWGANSPSAIKQMSCNFQQLQSWLCSEFLSTAIYHNVCLLISWFSHPESTLYYPTTYFFLLHNIYVDWPE
jgi:hypothetical protein